MDNQTMWRVRATAWELAAFSFRYPDGALEEAVASGEWAEAAGEIAAALGAEAPLGKLEHCAESAEAKDFLRLGCAGNLRAEATRLFVGAPEPAVSPYEGVWRAADDGVQALLFVNPHSMEVERFMRACGLGRPEGTNEPLDHVATECELLQHLASLEAGVAEPPAGDPAGGGLPGGSPEAAYGAFLEGHARTWMPRFAERVAAESRHSFYRAAAAYLKALMAC